MAADYMAFSIVFHRLGDESCRVEVDAGEERKATITAPAEMAFGLASSFMAGIVDPDSLEGLFIAPSAVDGPEGGTE